MGWRPLPPRHSGNPRSIPRCAGAGGPTNDASGPESPRGRGKRERISHLSRGGRSPIGEMRLGARRRGVCSDGVSMGDPGCLGGPANTGRARGKQEGCPAGPDPNRTKCCAHAHENQWGNSPGAHLAGSLARGHAQLAAGEGGGGGRQGGHGGVRGLTDYKIEIMCYFALLPRLGR